MGIVVQKYGGSSVADADGVKRVAQRIVDTSERRQSGQRDNRDNPGGQWYPEAGFTRQIGEICGTSIRAAEPRHHRCPHVGRR